MASEAAASHQQAGHMTAIAKEPSRQKALAKGPSTYGRGCAAGASAGSEEPMLEAQARFLKRQLSLPVSTMSQ